MSRPRSLNPSRAVSVSIPKNTLADIDEELGAMGSRSAWITSAIQSKLDGDDWNVVRDGTPFQMFIAFKQKLKDNDIHVDTMFLELIENNIKAQSSY